MTNKDEKINLNNLHIHASWIGLQGVETNLKQNVVILFHLDQKAKQNAASVGQISLWGVVPQL